MGYREEKWLLIVGSVFSIITGLSTLVSAGLKFSYIVQQLGWLFLIPISTFVLTTVLFGVFILRKGVGTQDPFAILQSTVTVHFDDPDGKVTKIHRQRYLRCLLQDLSSLYEGPMISDGRITTMTSVIYQVEDIDGRDGNRIQVTIPGSEKFKDEKRHIREIEFILATPLKKGQLYKHIVNWTVEDGFCENKEFYNLTVGYITGKAELEVFCHNERRFVPNSASVVQTAKQGLKIRTGCSQKYFNQAENKISFAIEKPKKGDAFKVAWEWRKSGKASGQPSVIAGS